MVKRLLIAVLLSVLVVSTAVAKDGNWAVYGLNIPDPKQHDTFDNGYAVEGQYRIPLDDGLSVGFMLGIGQWDADDYDYTTGKWIFKKRTKIYGTLHALAVGVCVLQDIPLPSDLFVLYV